MTLALSLNNIACEIDDRVLFSNLTVQFNSGDLVQIVGPNGAGKTTLLRILTGISSNYEGQLSWCGHPVPSYEFYSSLLYIGHLTGAKASLTPLENLSWYFGLNGSKAPGGDESVANAAAPITQASILQALEAVGLGGYENVPGFQMSAGQQRRIALARLYLSKAPLWILDEPFTAIDKLGVANLEKHFNKHREQGGIVILTTHQSLSYAEPKMVDLADYAGGELWGGER